MRNILVNTQSGTLIPMPLDEDLGVEGNKLKNNPLFNIVEVTDDIFAHTKKRHCRYDGINVVLLPENEWLENIVPEEQIEEETV